MLPRRFSLQLRAGLAFVDAKVSRSSRHRRFRRYAGAAPARARRTCASVALVRDVRFDRVKGVRQRASMPGVRAERRSTHAGRCADADVAWRRRGLHVRIPVERTRRVRTLERRSARCSRVRAPKRDA